MPHYTRRQVRRNLALRGDGEVIVRVGFSVATWLRHGRDLEAVVLRHPWCFPDYPPGDFTRYEPGPVYREGERFSDAWGCVWHNARAGMEGLIAKPALADLRKFPGYQPPDPLTQAERGPRPDWEELGRRWRRQRRAGEFTSGGGDRFFERVHFVLGFEQMMVMVAEGNPLLEKLIAIVLQHNLTLINRQLEVGPPDFMGFADDLGTQKSLMISPAAWRRLFKPGYRAMFGACRAAGCFVGLHSDGQIAAIFDDLVEIGANILNLQVSMIGLDTVAKGLKGRLCISADVDRQGVMPFGSPADVRNLVGELVTKLGSPRGGLELSADIYPDVPLANIEALLQSLDQWRGYWVGRG